MPLLKDRLPQFGRLCAAIHLCSKAHFCETLRPFHEIGEPQGLDRELGIWEGMKDVFC